MGNRDCADVAKPCSSVLPPGHSRGRGNSQEVRLGAEGGHEFSASSASIAQSRHMSCECILNAHCEGDVMKRSELSVIMNGGMDATGNQCNPADFAGTVVVANVRRR